MTVSKRLTIALTAFALLAGLPSTAQAGGCTNKLGVTHSFKSAYSAAYKGNKVPLTITSQGAYIHHYKAELYTFNGELVAKSKYYSGGFNRSKRLKLKSLYGPMQSGKYTLIITGEPNANRSCGPKKYTKVVEFHDCPKALPIEFPNPPGGRARDYGRWLSVHLRPAHGVLRDVHVELFDFEDNFFGSAHLKALFGTATVNIKLRHKLVKGGYTLVVNAKAGLPRSCGKKSAKKVLTFGPPQSGGGDGDDGGGGFDGGGDDDGSNDGLEPGFGQGGTEGGDGTEA
jgi:hypothetical protein